MASPERLLVDETWWQCSDDKTEIEYSCFEVVISTTKYVFGSHTSKQISLQTYLVAAML